MFFDPNFRPQFTPQGWQGAAPQPAPANWQQQAAPLVQISAGYMRDAVSYPIVKLYQYLEKNSSRNQQVAAIAPVVLQAVELYRQQDYARAFQQAFQAYLLVAQLRMQQPDLPEL